MSARAKPEKHSPKVCFPDARFRCMPSQRVCTIHFFTPEVETRHWNCRRSRAASAVIPTTSLRPTMHHSKRSITFSKDAATRRQIRVRGQSCSKIPAVLKIADGRAKVEMHGPLNTASSLTENLLLEYTDDKPAADVGWGCVDSATLRDLMALHSAGEDFADRTPTVARAGATNLVQSDPAGHAAAHQRQACCRRTRQARRPALMLVGHDTNVANVAGLLNLSWILDGRRDDTPPGGALVFELWRSTNTEWSVRRTTQRRRSSRCVTRRP